jgi:hypothetical protein
MRRRSLLTLLGASAAAWPLPAAAQQVGPMRRVSVLMTLPDGDPGGAVEVEALTSGLREHGWVEGRNIHVEYRWPGGDVERVRAQAKEAVALKPDVVIARSTPAALALKAETRTIPVVFVSLPEPTVSGLVETLARPGGNITGFTNFDGSIGGKWLELLKEVSPGLKPVTIIYNPDTAPFAQACQVIGGPTYGWWVNPLKRLRDRGRPDRDCLRPGGDWFKPYSGATRSRAGGVWIPPCGPPWTRSGVDGVGGPYRPDPAGRGRCQIGPLKRNPAELLVQQRADRPVST